VTRLQVTRVRGQLPRERLARRRGPAGRGAPVPRRRTRAVGWRIGPRHLASNKRISSTGTGAIRRSNESALLIATRLLGWISVGRARGGCTLSSHRGQTHSDLARTRALQLAANWGSRAQARIARRSRHHPGSIGAEPLGLAGAAWSSERRARAAWRGRSHPCSIRAKPVRLPGAAWSSGRRAHAACRGRTHPG